MIFWEYRQVTFKFQLSDKSLFKVSLPLQVRNISLTENVVAVEDLIPPSEECRADSQGYAIRSLPVKNAFPSISKKNNFYCYVQKQYQHCYIDMRMSFDDYKQKFSSKSRSTITRKVNKFEEYCEKKNSWRVYKTADEMRDFHLLARQVSKKTYQEKLLDAGIPDNPQFIQEMTVLAADQKVRGYILFNDAVPVSYLYCPIVEDALIYAYLGYDPAYLKQSVGTVLQWYALQDMFAENRFKIFDFTEGQSEHKRFFSTHELSCVNVCFLRPNIKNRILIYSHFFMDSVSNRLGDFLNRFGLKTKIKKILRFGF
ncbi:GNAT family N-acetyltransferase [Undibacterium sp. Ren11W]|uniref:GNAT family N-acetyltransferase n=1 Tax=Undibacterium sp. Ren11W TaxID=3413045 RepID=UPI003BF176A9